MAQVALRAKRCSGVTLIVISVDLLVSLHVARVNWAARQPLGEISTTGLLQHMPLVTQQCLINSFQPATLSGQQRPRARSDTSIRVFETK
jgi:hypothetical protein